MKSVLEQAEDAQKAWRLIRAASAEAKDTFLHELERLVRTRTDEILTANRLDLEGNVDLKKSLRRRLELTPASLQSIADGVRVVAELPDPVGSLVSSLTRPDGLTVERVRLPIGVIAAIFESRPNIIIDIAALCIKSGNVAIVRGGKEALHSNTALHALIDEALRVAGLPTDAVQQLEDRRYEAVYELVGLDQYVNLAIPRGGEALIKGVMEHARVPVIQHMRGLCHLFIDASADADKAVAIAVNAKTSNPATCNSIETIVVHSEAAPRIMPNLLKALMERGVEVRGCSRTCQYDSSCIPATEGDWETEYLDAIVSIRIVDSFDEAISHIEKYSSGLADAIVTEDIEGAERFVRIIDSAAVLINASTRLIDGAQLGLGAEIGISSAHIHMRGPMGLQDLTVPSYRLRGNGHIRG